MIAAGNTSATILAGIASRNDPKSFSELSKMKFPPAGFAANHR